MMTCLKTQNTLIQETLDMHLDFSDEEGDGQGAQGNAEGGDDPKRSQYSEQERREIRDEMKEAIMNAAKGAGNKDKLKVLER